MSDPVMPPESPPGEDDLRAAVKDAARLIEPRSVGIFCRRPLVDGDLPEVSDVDLVSIWDRMEEWPERMVVEGPGGRVFVDILWVPAAAMLDPVKAAGYRMLPHLLLESEEIWVRSEAVRDMARRIRDASREKGPWEYRLGSQIGFGDAALAEASRNLDFPPASLFYLQTASSYYLTALADSLGESVMHLVNRPMAGVRRLEAVTGCRLEQPLVEGLRLEGDPPASLAALGRVHTAVTARCAARKLQGVNARTRGHYAYSLSPLELEYRNLVAAALIRRGDRSNALYYLRFWAYSLARCPVVLEEANDGRRPSFYVPFRPLGESLRTACPEILGDLATILGGGVTAGEAGESARRILSLRGDILAKIEERGFSLPVAPDRTGAGGGKPVMARGPGSAGSPKPCN
jgi:hypothetical protein